MKKTVISNFLKLILCLMFAVIKMQAANVTWQSPVNGNWNDGTKWSGGVAPGVNDTALITVAGNYTVTMNVSTTVAKLEIGIASGYQTLNINGQTLTLSNSSTVNPHGILDFQNYSTLSGSGTLTNNGKILLNLYNTISANLNNTDSIIVDYYGNIFTGTYTNTAASVLHFRCASYYGQLTFSTGWTNNGKILLAGSYYWSQLGVTTGVIVNPVGSIIQSAPNAYQYNRIDAAVNNQGTMNIDGSLQIYTSTAASTNTGIVNYTSANAKLTYYNGIVNWNGAALNFNTNSSLDFSSATLNWNSGTTTGNGQFNFESSTGNFLTPAAPNVRMYFNYSTFASPQLPIISSHLIQFNAYNTISAAIFNTDTFRVSHTGNVMSGALTTAIGSLISIDGSNYHSSFTTTSGFTNNGTIDLKSVGSYNAAIGISSGVMINASTGIIHSYAGPYVSALTVTGGVNNFGFIIVDVSLTHNNASATSINTGTITIANGQTYTLNGGTYNFNGGTATGDGKWNYNGVTANYNVAAFPTVFEYYDNSTINSSFNPIANNHTLQLNSYNTVAASITNNDTIRVSYSGNIVNGTMTSVASSILSIEGSNYHSDITFNTDFTNSGLVELRSISGYNSALYLAAPKIFTNTASGIFKSWLGYYPSSRTIGGSFVNNGNFIVDVSLTHNNASATSTNTGTITIANGQTYTLNGGTYNFNGGTATGDGKWNYSSVTANYNVAAFPTVFEYYDYSTINSSFNPIANNHTLQLNAYNTVAASITNNDTIRVSYLGNIVNGTMTSLASSILSIEGSNYHSDITFNTDFTNSGLVELRSISGYNSALYMAAPKIFTNTAAGILKSWLGNYPSSRTIGGSFVNNGNFIVDVSLIHNNASATSTNTGTITIANGQTYTLNGGTYNFNGGTATGDGKWNYNGVTANYNVVAFPSVYEWFDNSIINSSATPVTNNNVLHFNSNNVVNASIQNNDSVLVSHYANVVHGNFFSALGSKLSVNGLSYHSDITFDNAFTNHGIVELITISGYNSSLYFTNGTFINETDGVFRSGGIYNVTHTLQAPSFENKGLMSNEFNLHFNMTAAAKKYYNKSSGTFKAKGTIYHDFNTSFVNEGSFQPGASPGQVDFNHYSTDSIHFTSSSNLYIEIGGYSVGSQFDRMNYNGQQNLNGALNLSLVNGFVPALGDSFIIVTYASKTGTFATITGQNIGGGLYWNVFYRSTYVVIRAGNPPNLDIVSSAGANGNISPLGTTSIVYNGAQSYSFISDLNYSIDSVFVDGVYAGNTSSYTFNNVIVNHTIHVTFKLITWTITASTNGNGTINPSGSIVVNQGSNQLFNITSNPCFILDSVMVDGVYVGSPSSYTFNNVNANHTIYASFSAAPHITSSGPLSFCAGNSTTLNTGAGYAAYLWSTSATTQTILVSTGGIYTCTVTGSGGCTSSTSVTVTVNLLPVVTFSDLYPSDNNHTCITSVGIGLNGVGLPIGGSYSGTGVQCSSGCVFTPSIAGLGAHTLTYNYTDSNSCSGSASQIVTVDQNATADAGPPSSVLCNTLVFSLNGTVGGIAVSGTWTTSGSGSFNNANALNAIYTLSSADSLAGTVNLTLTTNDPAGPCGAVSDQIVLYYNPDAVANAGSDQCSGAAVNVSGTITGYAANPQWSTLGSGTFVNANAYNTTYNASGADLSAGFVNLVLTPIDPNGNCTFTADTVKIYFDPQYFVNAGIDQTICNQSLDSIYLFGITTAVQSVSWSTSGSGTFANPNLAQTHYVLSIADKANGYIILTITSDDPAGPCTAVSESMILKYKYASVDAGVDICGDTITALSGTVNTNTYSATQLNYQWSTSGSGTFGNSNIIVTNYNAANSDITTGTVKLYLAVTDNTSECLYNMDSVTIWFNQHYSINAGPTNDTICANTVLNLNGTANNVVTKTWTTNGDGIFGNANAPVTTYTPGNADTTAHSVKLYFTSDEPAGPCIKVMDSILVLINGLPHATAGTNSPVCIGGDLDLTASGGTSYVWSGPGGYSSTDQNIIRSNATLAMNGTYTVTVTDVNTCTTTATTVALVQNCSCTVPVLSETHINPSCFGSSNGSIDLTIVSGVGVYAFQWSNGATTEDISGLSSGTYICTVSAGVGCTDIIVVQINQSPLSIVLNGTNVSSYGNNNGAVTSSISGGTPSYTYNWSNGASTQHISTLIAGTYTLTVTDFNGCTASSSVNITQPAPFVISGVVTNVNSCGSTNSGALDISIANGTAPYSYLWNDGASTEDRIDLTAGIYTVTITDNSPSTLSASFTVQTTVNTPPVVSVSSSAAAVCPGSSVTLTRITQ